MTEPHFPDLLLWAIPVFLLLIGAELLWLRKHPIKNAYTLKDGVTSLIMGLGMSVSDFIFKGVVLGLMFWVWKYRIFDLGHSIWVILLALVLMDFVYYWVHYSYHKSRWFWATHVVHHSSEHYNLTTALRQPWSNGFSGSVLFKLPLVLLGFHPLILVFVMAINLLYQFWIHTETVDKCPRWFEFIFNTPSHHRVHHGRNPRYLDANFAGILIIWDRMFGTFVPEQADDKPDYGIVTPLRTYNPITVAFHEFAGMAKDVTQSGISLGQRVKYIFAAPGYCHDGSRKTGDQIKADYVDTHPQQASTPGLPSLETPNSEKQPLS